MKILHTSDWHLGQIFYSYDRTDEYLDFFRQLKDLTELQRPDAMLVSGDIFDVSTPSASIMRIFTDFILELHEAVPDMAIVVISGNHDSASRIDVNRNLWKQAGIYVFGNVVRKDGEYDFSENIVKLPEKGYILAVPYVNKAFMTSRTKDVSPEQSFFEKAAEAMSVTNSDFLPSVLMAHLTVAGCDMTGHRKAEIGNISAVDAGILQGCFDYVALGHIHRAQNISGDGHIRYCGTPVAVGFDEEYSHTVSIVSVNKGEEPTVEEVEIAPLRKLKTFPTEAVDFKRAIKLLKKLPDTDNSYIRLNVAQENDLPADCQELATMATQGKDCRFCLIKYSRLNSSEDEGALFKLRASELNELSPEDVAVRFFNTIGLPDSMSDEYVQLISQIKEDIAVDKTL